MGRRTRLVNPPSNPPPHPVHQVKVDLLLWQEAIRRAGGDTRRIVVESATSVLIVNHPRPRRLARRIA